MAEVTDTTNTDERWYKAYWLPTMGWLYALICFFDFIGFPLISIFIPVFTKVTYVAWVPITLNSGGLVHLSFASILGVHLYSKGRLDIQNAENEGKTDDSSK